MGTNDNWTRWYRTGTVKVTKGSATIEGSGTYWLKASLHPGDIFSLDNVTDYEVSEVVDDTHLTLLTPYQGKTAAGQEYSIVRSFSATTGAELASQTADLVQKMSRYVNTDMQTVQGKDAYELAVDNGYVGTRPAWIASLKGDSAYDVAVAGGYKGTQAEWLESLKAAQEWSRLDARTSIMDEANPKTLHNRFYRGKNLGEHPTPAQYAAIRNNTFDDLYVGDYWKGTYGSMVILHINYYGWLAFLPNAKFLDPLTGTTHTVTGQGGANINVFKPHIIVQVNTPSNTSYYTAADKKEDGTYVGYTQCNWYRTMRPQLLARAISCFGDEHVLEWADYCPTGYSAEGKPLGWACYVQRCEMLYSEQLGLGHTDMSRETGGVWGPFARHVAEVAPSHLEHYVCRDIVGASGGSLLCRKSCGIYNNSRICSSSATGGGCGIFGYVMIGSRSAAEDELRSPAPSDDEEGE